MSRDETQVSDELREDLVDSGAAELARTEYDLVEPTDESVTLCALCVHRAVEALNGAHNEYTIPWDKNRASIEAGVRRLLEKGGRESPEENHEAWMSFKQREGWRYGPNKDAEAKTHPCLVPYEHLPPVQKSKDLIFQAIVRAFFGLEESAEVSSVPPSASAPSEEKVLPLDPDAPLLEHADAASERISLAATNLFAEVREGDQRAYNEDPHAVYVVYHWSAEVGSRDWTPTLVTRALRTLERLRELGGVTLLWRVKPNFHVIRDAGTYLALRMRLAVLDKDGSELRVPEELANEGHGPTRIDN